MWVITQLPRLVWLALSCRLRVKGNNVYVLGTLAVQKHGVVKVTVDA